MAPGAPTEAPPVAPPTTPPVPENPPGPPAPDNGTDLGQAPAIPPSELTPPEAMAPPPPTGKDVVPTTNPLPGLGPDYAPVGAYQPQSGVGVAVSAGGGVADFTNNTLRSNTGTAGSWQISVAAGTREYVGVEADYVGAAQSINGFGLANSGTLARNGLEGLVRVNAPFFAKKTLLEPYIFGGVGWAHYTITNVTIVTADLVSFDNVLTVPFGAGFSVGYKGFIGDLRFTYRPTFFDNLVSGLSGNSLNNWNAGAQVGYEF
jgi:hypothetical protein